jgi:type VI secretion system secreted protein VgrG
MMKLSSHVHARRAHFGVASVAALVLLVANPLSAQAAATPVPLGDADSFVVLAGETVTNTGDTLLDGDLGLYPGSAITGSETVELNGEDHVADTVASHAKAAFGTAYDNVAGRTPAVAIPNELGGLTKKPGIYSSGDFIVTNTLTLDAEGDEDALFIFQSADELTAAPGSVVKLINGASPCNVFWLVPSSATLNTTADFVGTILASTSIWLKTGATVEGRVWAATGEVTMQENWIGLPECAIPAGSTPTTSPTSTPSPTSTGSPSNGSGTSTGLPSNGSATPTATPANQVTQIPSGSVPAGDGSTSGNKDNQQALMAGGLLLALLGGPAVMAVRRRRPKA